MVWREGFKRDGIVRGVKERLNSERGLREME